MADFMTPLMFELADVVKEVGDCPLTITIDLKVWRGNVSGIYSIGYDAETNTSSRWWTYTKEEFFRRVAWSRGLALAPQLPIEAVRIALEKKES